ncbi:MAG: hypothetical protein HYZ27_05590 [Deltaproteobacteria bacterium]|nr:hypothetical protein [Deltaproteobacteria bacterium]
MARYSGALVTLAWVTAACESAEPPHVLAFYYGWYGTPEHSGGWRHWNDAGHDPENILAGGLRDIAAAHYPQYGVYDSLHPALIDRHLADAEAAGLTGLVVSWWGPAGFEDRALEALLDRIEARASPLKVAVYYEQVPDHDPARAIIEIAYLREHYFARSSYLRSGGAPVLLVYGRAILPGVFCLFEACSDEVPPQIDWGGILKASRAGGPISAWGDVISQDFFPEHARILADMGFTGVHAYNPHVEVSLGLDMQEVYDDLVASARHAGASVALTLIPGYDDTALTRPFTSQIARDGTALYERLWDAALRAAPDLYLVTTFNEWHEGTEIEASREHGAAFIGLTADRAAAR